MMYKIVLQILKQVLLIEEVKKSLYELAKKTPTAIDEEMLDFLYKKILT